MANYYSNSRTNYFRVIDEEKYAELFSNLVGDEGEIYDFSKIENDILLHGFGCYGSIDYQIPTQDGSDDYDYDFDLFLKELQKILPENEAFIYMESGHEKLRYITGLSIVVTNDKIDSIDIRSSALNLARKMLDNDQFQTELEY
jgi:hypothetical protein